MKIQRKIAAYMMAGTVLLGGLFCAYFWDRQHHRLLEIINSGHVLVVSIRMHVEDTGQFPDDLNTLVKDGDLPANYKRLFEPDVQIS